MTKRIAVKVVMALSLAAATGGAAWHYAANDWRTMPLGNVVDDQGRAWGENGVKVPWMSTPAGSNRPSTANTLPATKSFTRNSARVTNRVT